MFAPISWLSPADIKVNEKYGYQTFLLEGSRLQLAVVHHCCAQRKLPHNVQTIAHTAVEIKGLVWRSVVPLPRNELELYS